MKGRHWISSSQVVLSVNDSAFVPGALASGSQMKCRGAVAKGPLPAIRDEKLNAVLDM